MAPVERLTLALLLLAGCAEPPAEDAWSGITLVARSDDECIAAGPAVLEAIAFWADNGVAWSPGDCEIADDYPGAIEIGEQVTEGLVERQPGVTLYVVDSVTFMRPAPTSRRAFMAHGGPGRCDVVGAMVADASSGVVAHELGHAVGLAHEDDSQNLMAPVPGDELRDWQIDTAAQRMEACQ